jgi:hypothetical protein
MVSLVVGWKTGAVFNPEDVNRMIEAYQMAWQALSFAFDVEFGPEATDARRLLAAAVLKHSCQDAPSDVTQLCRMALEDMPAYSASWVR